MTVASPPVADLAGRLAAVRARIERAGADPEQVRIVAVSKGHPAADVEAALAVGLRSMGESYPQELLAKAADVAGPVAWHWIGRLQRNKVARLAPLVACWESIDRPELAEAVARHAPGTAVLVQVHVSGEVGQGGAAPDAVPALVADCRGLGLDVRGLMAIGARGDEATVRASFRVVRTLADRLGLAERSMGMSGDLEAAVAEGSTSLRIGTALFGPRGGSAAMGN